MLGLVYCFPVRTAARLFSVIAAHTPDITTAQRLADVRGAPGGVTGDAAVANTNDQRTKARNPVCCDLAARPETH